MKKLIISSLLACATLIINAQADENPVISVSLEKLNILYIGIDNPVSIAVSGISKNDIKANINNGQISGKDGKYIVNPKNEGKAVISIFKNNNSNEPEKIGSFEYRVYSIPYPEAQVGGLKNGIIRKSELIKQDSISIYLKDFLFDLHFKITEFEVSTIHEGRLKEMISNGNKFTEEQKVVFNNVILNQKVFIKKIQCIDTSGKIYQLNNIVLTVYEDKQQ